MPIAGQYGQAIKMQTNHKGFKNILGVTDQINCAMVMSASYKILHA